jgi:acetoin utilization deacetylase AcuC-like enzyme
MTLEIVTPDQADRASLLTVHDAGYLDFVRDAHAAGAAMSNAGEDVVANSHPSPELLTEHIMGQARLIRRCLYDRAAHLGSGLLAAARALGGLRFGDEVWAESIRSFRPTLWSSVWASTLQNRRRSLP